jgi:hypothetical protein
MITVRVGRVVRTAVLFAALLALRPATPPANTSPVAIVITDTSMSLDPSTGSGSTSFTATLTYTPREEVCPPKATTVSFTWDGHAVGDSTMQSGASPCRATLPTKPLAGYTAVGTHQVCGTFQYQGEHKGCAPFEIAAANPAASPSHPSSSSPKSQGGSTSAAAPRASSSSKPAATRTSPVAPRTFTPTTRPVAAPDNKTEDGAANGLLIGVTIGGLALLIALAGSVRKRLHRSS